MEKKQTKAQRNGTLTNIRRGLIHRQQIARMIVPIADHNPTIRTDDVVKQVNKKIKSRKRTRNKVDIISPNSLQKPKEIQFKISEPEVIRAIKENIDLFTKNFVDARRIELDKIILSDQQLIVQNEHIDSFFKIQNKFEGDINEDDLDIENCQ